MEIDRMAAELQSRANDRFIRETEGVSRYQWRAIADRIAGEVFGNDWDYEVVEMVGGNISFLAMQYHPAASR